MRTLIVSLLALTGVGLTTVAASADPDRPVAVYTDRCWNLPGLQMDAHFDYGLVRWKVKTPERGDCRRLSPLTVV